MSHVTVAFYDTTGAITQIVATDDFNLPLYTQPYVGIDKYDLSYCKTHYVADEVFTPRVPITYTCPSTATVGTAITLTAPASAAVNIDGVGQGVIDSTGSEQITFADAGVYTITLSLWPYTDVTFEVTAS